MKTIKYLSLIIFAAFAVAACSDDNTEKKGEEEIPEVKLEIVFDQPETFYLCQSKEITYTLPEDQPTSITAVEVPEGWKVDISADTKTIAIRCGYSAEDGIAQIMLSDDNDNSSKTPLTLSNNGKSFYVLDIVVHNGMPLRNLSPNGQWVAGYFGLDYGFTHKVGSETFESFSSPVYGVSNEGKAQLSMNEGSDTYADYRKVAISLPDGGSEDLLVPIVVLDGVQYDLPQPETDYAGRGVEQLYCGHRATAISADRKIIMGYMLDVLSARLAVMWKLNEQTGKYEYNFIREDLFKAVNNNANEYLELTGEMSPNGKYAACSFVKGGLSFGALYNTETDEVITMEEQPDALGLMVSNDGKLFFSSPRISRQRESFVYEDGAVVTMKYWIKNTYGIDMLSNYGSPMAHLEDFSSFILYEYGADFGGFANYLITNRDILAANGTTIKE